MMVETKSDQMGIWIEVPENWVELQNKQGYESFYGAMPKNMLHSYQGFKSIGQLVKEHNAKTDDDLQVFYWDNLGNIIFGHVFKDLKKRPLPLQYNIETDKKPIQGFKVTNLKMVRKYYDSGKLVKTKKGPVLQMLNCFDDIYNKSLTDYLRNLSPEDRADELRKFLGHVKDPTLEFYLQFDEIHFKKVKRQFREELDYNSVLFLAQNNF